MRIEKTERLTDDGKRVLRTVDDDIDRIGGAGRDFIIEDGNSRKRILRAIGFASQLVDKKRKRRAKLQIKRHDIIFFDSDKRFKLCNAASENIIRFDAELVIGKEFVFKHKPRRPQAFEGLRTRNGFDRFF